MLKVTFLFWNLNRRPLLPLINAIAREHRVDVLVLTECEIPPSQLLVGLNTNEPSQFFYPVNPSPKLLFLVRFPPQSLEYVIDFGSLAVRRLRPPIGIDLLLVAAHLPSKLHKSEVDQMLMCTQVIQDIEGVEQSTGHSRTVFFGDMNMNPFEAGVVGAAGFHAVMNRRVAAKGERSIDRRIRRYFYNPMWSYFGDYSPGPSGTYYYHRANQVDYFWNMFDQVLVRPALLPRFADSDVSILTKAGETSLLSRHEIPDRGIGSDHLPILFRINVEEELSA